MGIRVSYHRVSPEHLATLRSDVDALRDFVYADNVQVPFVSIEKGHGGLHWLLDTYRRVTWRNHPRTARGRIVMGGAMVNRAFSEAHEDYPTRFLSNAEVNSAASDLAGISRETLRAEFDWTAMTQHPDPNMQIYGAFLGEVYDHRKGSLVVYTESEHFERYWGHFVALRDFYRSAADSGDCVVALKD